MSAFETATTDQGTTTLSTTPVMSYQEWYRHFSQAIQAVQCPRIKWLAHISADVYNHMPEFASASTFLGTKEVREQLTLLWNTLHSQERGLEASSLILKFQETIQKWEASKANDVAVRVREWDSNYQRPNDIEASQISDGLGNEDDSTWSNDDCHMAHQASVDVNDVNAATNMNQGLPPLIPPTPDWQTLVARYDALSSFTCVTLQEVLRRVENLENSVSALVPKTAQNDHAPSGHN